MKKYILGSLVMLLVPFFSQAALMGFGDNKYYNEQGINEWSCFENPNGQPDNDDCLNLLNGQTSTRKVLGIGRPPKTVRNPLPQSIPQTVYVPVYIPETTGQNIQPSPQPTPAPTPKPTSVPQPVTPVLLPAYTEAQLITKIGQSVNISVAGGNFVNILPINLTPLGTYNASSVSITLIRSKCPSNTCKINFQGQPLIDLSKPDFDYDNDGDSAREQIDNLIPYTKYTFDFIYTEQGREDTVVTKTFQTHCGSLCFY